MSLSLKSLVRMSTQSPVGSTAGAAQTQVVSHFLYGTDDALATVATAGYFNSARALLKKGDLIAVSGANSGTPVRADYVVTAVPTSGNVTIAAA
jgi:hypothetical protein